MHRRDPAPRGRVACRDPDQARGVYTAAVIAICIARRPAIKGGFIVYHAILIIGYGKKRRYIPATVTPSGTVYPSGILYKTEAAARDYIEGLGYTVAAAGGVYEIIGRQV